MITNDMRESISYVLDKVEKMAGIKYERVALLVPDVHRGDWPNRFKVHDRCVTVLKLSSFPDDEWKCREDEILVVGLT